METALTAHLRHSFFDHLLRGVPYVPPEKLYLALYTSKIDDSGRGQEVSVAGYKRQVVKFVTAGMRGRYVNDDDISFGLAEEPWGTIKSIAVVDAEKGGNVLFFGPPKIEKSIVARDEPKFRKGDFLVRLPKIEAE